VAASKSKKKITPGPAARKASKSRTAAAQRGWETRRAREREALRLAEARARARKKRAKERRVAAEKLRLAKAEAARVRKAQRRRRHVRVRAEGALSTFVRAVDAGTRDQELRAVKESWHREKRALERVYDGDAEAFFAVLDAIAEASGTDWDIAYGSPNAA
jgi:hypothetical protein